MKTQITVAYIPSDIEDNELIFEEKWTDCQTVCRQKNLPVEFSKKPKLVLKK